MCRIEWIKIKNENKKKTFQLIHNEILWYVRMEIVFLCMYNVHAHTIYKCSKLNCDYVKYFLTTEISLWLHYFTTQQAIYLFICSHLMWYYSIFYSYNNHNNKIIILIFVRIECGESFISFFTFCFNVR